MLQWPQLMSIDIKRSGYHKTIDTKLMSQIFNFGDLRSGQFCGLPIIFKAMAEKSKPSFAHKIR